MAFDVGQLHLQQLCPLVQGETLPLLGGGICIVVGAGGVSWVDWRRLAYLATLQGTGRMQYANLTGCLSGAWSDKANQ